MRKKNRVEVNKMWFHQNEYEQKCYLLSAIKCLIFASPSRFLFEVFKCSTISSAKCTENQAIIKASTTNLTAVILLTQPTDSFTLATILCIWLIKHRISTNITHWNSIYFKPHEIRLELSISIGTKKKLIRFEPKTHSRFSFAQMHTIENDTV